MCGVRRAPPTGPCTLTAPTIPAAGLRWAPSIRRARQPGSSQRKSQRSSLRVPPKQRQLLLYLTSVSKTLRIRTVRGPLHRQGTSATRVHGSSGVWPLGASCCQHGPSWQINMDHPSSFDQQQLGDLFRSREHWKMVADLDHAVVTAGFGSGANLTGTSRTSDGQTIIAYIPNGKPRR
jgi:hypothetical protein